MIKSRLVDLGAFLFCCASFLAASAVAEEDRGTFSILIENDRMVNTDRHYTHGTRLSWLSPADDVPDWARDVAGHVPLFAKQRSLRIGYGLGQSIFTPEDTSSRALIPKDRPYAGWLYVSLSLVADTGRRLDSLELDLGIVGPAALGQDVQNNFHDLIGVGRSNGWGRQLDNEPGLVLYCERKWRKLKEFSAHGLGVDVTPTSAAASATCSPTWRVGWRSVSARTCPATMACRVSALPCPAPVSSCLRTGSVSTFLQARKAV